MIKEPIRRSPLQNRAPLIADNVSVTERAFLTKIVLRGEFEVFKGGVKKATGLAIPAPLKSVSHDTCVIHWQGPDTLLLIAKDGEEVTLVEKLKEALSGTSHQITPVSHYYTVLEIKGDHARDVLQKLSTLNLHQSAFKKGAVAGTAIAHSTVTLACRDDAPDTFDMVIRWTHADYMWCLLANAGHEFGFEKVLPVADEILRQ